MSRSRSAAPTPRPPVRAYAIVTATGAVIMALEILASRVLAPFFGNSVYVWGSIISVFLAALSLGYAWGGRLADRHPRLEVLGRLLAAAAVFQAALLLAGRPLAGLFATWTGHSPGGTLLATTALFGAPSVLLATVSPFTIRLAARDLGRLGDTAGRLFAFSTAGSLFGTLAATFLLIPFLELGQILGLLLLVNAATAAFALAGAWRREALWLTLAGLASLLALSALAFPAGPDPGTLYSRVTPYQALEVTEQEGVRFLRGDRAIQSAVLVADRLPALQYLRYPPVALALQPEPESLLVLGMGGGALGRYLRVALPGLEIDYVDIDPAIPLVARRFFFFDDDARTRVHVEDARQFLNRAERTWDLIYADAYIGLSVPFHLTTAEFVELVRERLAPGGVFALNLPADLGHPFARAMVRTVGSRFTTLYAFDVQGSTNTLVLAADRGAPLPDDRLLELAAAWDRRVTLYPTLQEIAGRRIEVAIDPERDRLLTDEFAPANHLIRLGEAKR